MKTRKERRRLAKLVGSCGSSGIYGLAHESLCHLELLEKRPYNVSFVVALITGMSLAICFWNFWAIFIASSLIFVMSFYLMRKYYALSRIKSEVHYLKNRFSYQDFERLKRFLGDDPTFQKYVIEQTSEQP